MYVTPTVTKHYLHYISWHYFIAVLENGQKCWVQDRHNIKLQYTGTHTNPYSRMKEICVWSHTALTVLINVVWGLFSPQVIWRRALTTQIRHRSMKSNLLTEYCHVLMYSRFCSTVYPIYIIICLKWIIPGTKTWSENEHIYKEPHSKLCKKRRIVLKLWEWVEGSIKCVFLF